MVLAWECRRTREVYREGGTALTRPSLRAPLDELRAEAAGALSTATLAEVEREYILRVLRERTV